MPSHVREEEFGSPLEDRVDTLLKELFVCGEAVMLPELHGEPETAGGKDSPAKTPAGRGEAPWIGDHMGNPTRCAVHPFGGSLSCNLHLIDEVEQGLLRFRKVADLCKPIVLLGIDVEVEIICPTHAGGEAIIPNSLQG